MAEGYPKKISENGWYELSNGERVRGEDDAIEAEARLDKEDEVLANDPEFVADREEAEREYEAGETQTLAEFEQELEEEKGPAPIREQAGPEALDGKTCANCERPASVVDDSRRTVNKVYYCHRHKPVYLR